MASAKTGDLRVCVRGRRRTSRPRALPDGFCSTARLGGTGGTLRNLHVHLVSPAEILVTLARVFSFSSLEINRFIEIDDARRVLFVRNHLWLLPLLAIVWAAGIVQPLWMLVSWFRSQADHLPTGVRCGGSWRSPWASCISATGS